MVEPYSLGFPSAVGLLRVTPSGHQVFEPDGPLAWMELWAEAGALGCILQRLFWISLGLVSRGCGSCCSLAPGKWSRYLITLRASKIETLFFPTGITVAWKPLSLASHEIVKKPGPGIIFSLK